MTLPTDEPVPALAAYTEYTDACTQIATAVFWFGAGVLLRPFLVVW